MIRNFLNLLKQLFNIKTETSNHEIDMNDKFADDYRAIDDINYTSIFANKLANLVTSDSSANIENLNKRSKQLNDVLQLVMSKSKKIVGMQLGYGGVCIVPYISKGQLYYTIVEQNRLTIDEKTGDRITGATLLAEQKTITYGSVTEKYFRWVNYKIDEKNTITIEQKYTDVQGQEVDISEIPEWATINPVETITNVDRVLFGYIQSPINNRIGNDKYGVPITFGCEETIREIKECLKQIAREYEIKKGFIGIDDKMYDAKGGLPKNGLFKKFRTDADEFFEIYSPEIRDSAYFNRLQELYTRLEKEIGVSKGFLTDMESNNATATEIKRAMYDTYAMISDTRRNFEKGVDDFIYACNVLANRYGLTPMGNYKVTYNWDYSLITDTQEEFTHYTTGVSQGVISKAELRNWILPNETLEESQKAVDKIKEEEPSIDDLLGTKDDDTDNKSEINTDNTKTENDTQDKKDNSKIEK